MTQVGNVIQQKTKGLHEHIQDHYFGGKYSGTESFLGGYRNIF